MDTKVIGPETNCKESWDNMISVSGAGFKGIVRLANRVFYSLSLGPEFEEDREDIVQEALLTLYSNAEAWDTDRSFVSWASVVLKHSILRSINQRKNKEPTYDPHSMDQASEQDHYQEIDDKIMAWDIYEQANGQTQKVLDKIMNDESLTRNDYFVLDKFKRRMRERHG